MSINKKGNQPASSEAKQDDNKKNRKGKQSVATLVKQITEILARKESIHKPSRMTLTKIGKENSQ